MLANEAKASGKAIDIINDLARTRHFPVSSRFFHGLNPLVRGLLTKYRSLILEKQSHFETSSAFINAGGKGDVVELQNTIANLQNNIVRLTIEKNESMSDRDQALEVLDLIRMKYQSLLNDKIVINQNLLKVSIDLDVNIKGCNWAYVRCCIDGRESGGPH
jgi:hypothetical protein